MANVAIAVCAIVLLGLGIWIMNDGTFVDELLRSRLYMDTGYIALISSCFILVLSVFGCLAGYKQVKCLLLTYIVVCLLWVVVLVVGGVLAYIFRQQVADTILAEMIAEIRNYDPSDSHSSVTRAWDLTQSNLQCCGFMMPDTKDLVSHSWQMWRYNPMVNPSVDTLMVPRSCCVTDMDCVSNDNVTMVDNVWTGDCLQLSLRYAQDKANTIGAAAFATSSFLIFGMFSTFYLFTSIV